jgi:hypothetical protein
LYTSLDRIDIVTKQKETGRAGYLLTDHRTPAEVEAEPELSVLFALTRVTAALAMGAREGGADVSYVCHQAPPDFLCEAVASAGGSVTIDAGTQAPARASRPIGDIADEAFRGLARRVAGRDGGSLDQALLTRLEDETLQARPKQEDDEPSYWGRTLELAAVCGELLRAKTGGRWSQAADSEGLFPFAFTAGNGTFNVADKARRFMDQGESQRPGQLLLMADDLGHPDEGPLMVNLKPGDFPRDHGVCRDLFPEKAAKPDARMPVVFVGRDQPNTFAYLPAGSPEVERRFEEALANLARLELEAVPHEVAGVEMLVVSGHFYASEKILDEAFMLALQRRLGAELLAAAVPYKGVLLVTQQVVPPAVAGFVAAAAVLHQNTGGAPPLSAVVFLLKDGKLVGHIDTGAKQPQASSRPAPAARPRPGPPRKRPEPQPKPGFWSRLFRGGH